MEADGDFVQIDLSFPLDDDGFLRRECPDCGREFKWLTTSPHEGSAFGDDPSHANHDQPEVGSYHCPYCAVVAAADDWLTRGQARIVEQAVMDRVVNPGLASLEEC
jgi:hypothetical protein